MAKGGKDRPPRGIGLRGMGGMSPVGDEEQQAKMKEQVARRRETALDMDNFLMDGETAYVILSASKSRGGIHLVEEVSLRIPFTAWAEASAAFQNMITAAYVNQGTLISEGSGGANGPD